MDLLASGDILLKSVPNVVWSGIVGSLITVVGVLTTNLGLSRRHKQQLKHTADENALKRMHDAAESALDRRMKLRRDVYIPAIEAVHAAMSSLGLMADPSVPRSAIQAKIVDAVGLISKVNAVASLETVGAAGMLLQQLMTANMDLSLKRGPIEAAYAQEQANGNTVTRAVEDHGRWVQVQTSMLFDGPVPPEKWSFLKSQIAFQQKLVDEWTGKRAASFRDLQIAQLAFLKAMAASQSKLTDASVTTSIALRTELGMSEDSRDQLRGILTENGERARKALEETIERIEEGLRVSNRLPPDGDQKK
jgi:hypothetical protein